MQIREIMTQPVDVIDPSTTIRDVARRMREENIGALPVGENDRLVGMVTDRDIVVRAVADEQAPSTTSVRDVMSERIIYCFEDEEVDKAAEKMADHQIRRLAVLNRDKRLVGVVALADIARRGGGAAEKAIEGVSKPGDTPRR